MDKTTKDLYGNVIALDEQDQVIMKKCRHKAKTLFNQEPEEECLEDLGFLAQESRRATKLLNLTNQILTSSPFSSYTPDYLDPNNPRDKEQYKGWRELYLKEPAKGIIAPWTKKEKAYYLSLKTKKERVIYLTRRSGLKCAMIDMPDEAIGNAKAFPEITEKVEANRGTLKSMLHIGEWNLCAGLLGDGEGFLDGGDAGFKARGREKVFLAAQLGVNIHSDILNALDGIRSSYLYASTILGLIKNPLKATKLEALLKNPPLDEFGMLPFLDELIGVDWVMDFGRFDAYGDVSQELDKKLEAGELLDPRDPRTTKESREEFRQKTNFLTQRRAKGSALDLPYKENWDAEYEDERIELASKIMATIPPQGYIYAPYYYFPEELDELFYAGKLDRKLDPRIPAMDRAGFPKDLREKILEYAKKHNIKD